MLDLFWISHELNIVKVELFTVHNLFVPIKKLKKRSSV